MAAPRKKVEPKEVEVKEEVKVEEAEVKTRCDFNSWKEYNAYKGPKA